MKEETTTQEQLEQLEETANETKTQLASNAAQGEGQQQATTISTPKVTSVYNYATGKTQEAKDELEAESYANANRGLGNVYKYLQDNPDASNADLESVLGDDYNDFAYVYGGRSLDSSNARAFFGMPARRDVLAKLPGLAKNYGDYENALTAKKEADARAAVEARNAAPQTYKRGDKEYSISKGFSDFIKEKSEELSFTIDKDGKYTAESKPILNAIRDRMIQEGLLTTDNKNALKSLNDLYNLGETIQDKLAIRDIISTALSREDEVYTPETDTRTWEERFYDRESKRAQVERDKEAKRLQRERLGRGFAGLAATIGDMIRASEGAPVSPRDWQRIYDNLTAQEKANINSYQVRMAKLNDDLRNARLIKAKQEAAAAAAAQEHAQALQLLGIKEKGLNDRAAEKNRVYAEQQAANRKSRENIQNAKPQKKGNVVSISVFGQNYTIPNHARSAAANAAIAKLKSAGVSFGILKDIKGFDQQNVATMLAEQLLSTPGEKNGDKIQFTLPAYKVTLQNGTEKEIPQQVVTLDNNTIDEIRKAYLKQAELVPGYAEENSSSQDDTNTTSDEESDSIWKF